MKNSSFNYRDFEKKQLASQYIWLPNIGLYIKSIPYNFPLTGAGGLRTTVEDLSHFLIAHMNNGSYKNIKILKNSTINMMHNISAITAGKLYYGFGLGWLIYNDTNFSGHDGDLTAGHARMKWNKPGDFGIIYFWNSDEHKGNYNERLKIFANLEKEILKNI
jgi:CubicO group peptidase (beta-lactamase class C family)